MKKKIFSLALLVITAVSCNTTKRISETTGDPTSLPGLESVSGQYLETSVDLNKAGALKLAEQAGLEAQKLNKNVSIAILNSSGNTLLLLKGDQVGPHNTEASRKKAYTSLSTKTPSYELMIKASESRDARNLNTVADLLLLGGGAPIWKNGELVGGIGISGGGSGENDHNIALAALKNLGFTTE